MDDSDETSSVSSRSPVETLNESSSQNAPIQTLDHDKASISPPNSDDSYSSSVPSPINSEHGGECNTQSQIPHQIGSTLGALDETVDAILDSYFSYPPDHDQSWSPWPTNTASGYDTDYDSRAECSQPLLGFQQEEPLKIEEPIGVGAGLWNLGNTCFINSVLQCFTHTVPLLEGLWSYTYQDPCICGTENFCVIRTLRHHIEASLRPSRCPVSPYYILNNLNYFSPSFQRYQQEDAQEFLQAFLEKLERCCLDQRSYRGFTPSRVNIVENVFTGRLLSSLRCCSCNSVSKTCDPSLGFSLEIGDVDNLCSALDSFTCVEKLEGQFNCDNCKENVSKEKQLKIDKLPLVATFNLKIFKTNGVFTEKIFRHVNFPLELDMQPYMCSSPDNEVATKYHLYAFVEHLGSSLAYGHFVSYVKSAPKIWHKFDDLEVTKIDEDTVLSQDPYILFYVREGTPWFSKAYEEIQSLLEASSQNSSAESVLDPINGECVSDISSANVDKSNKPCESAGVSNSQVKTDESCVSLSNESTGKNSRKASVLDPLDTDDSYKPCPEPSHEEELDSCLAIERAAISEDFLPLLMVQSQDSPSKKGFSDIRLEDLSTGKNQEEEEEHCKQKTWESKETEYVHKDLMKKVSLRTRDLDQATSSPKKAKTA